MYAVFLQLLIESGKTVAEVARDTGINPSTFANWKRRNNLISGKYAKVVADYFGVTVDYLMGVEKPVRTLDDRDIDPVIMRALHTFPELQDLCRAYIVMSPAERDMICRTANVKKDAESSDSQAAVWHNSL